MNQFIKRVNPAWGQILFFIIGFIFWSSLGGTMDICSRSMKLALLYSVVFSTAHICASTIAIQLRLINKRTSLILLIFLNFMIFILFTTHCRVENYGVSAQNSLVLIAKECAVKKTNREINPIFDVPDLDHYTFKPVNGNCEGDENNLLTAVSEDLSKYPTFSYNVETRERTCSHEGPTGELNGCSTRRNGEW